MGFTSIFYGSGNKPYTASYEGSTYTTQTYCEPPQYKAALTMPTEFGSSIQGNTVPLAEYSNTMFTGQASGLWIYKLYLNDQLVGVYQFSDQSFSFSVTFDRVEGFCLGVPLTPGTPAISYTETSEPPPPPPIPSPASIVIPSPASIVILICSAIFSLRKNPRNA
jgi:hypothetical protein